MPTAAAPPEQAVAGGVELRGDPGDAAVVEDDPTLQQSRRPHPPDVSSASYWLEDEHPTVRLSGRARPADVAVIGAGVTGCACALSLAALGLGVRVYDARVVAGGASGRNGGFALRGGSMPYDEARTALGAEPARTLWELTEHALDEARGARRRCVPSRGEPPPRGGHGGARRARARVPRAERGRLRGRVGRRPRAARAAVPRRHLPPARRSTAPGALGAAARGLGGRGRRRGRRRPAGVGRRRRGRRGGGGRRGGRVDVGSPAGARIARSCPCAVRCSRRSRFRSCCSRGRTTRATGSTTGSSSRTGGSSSAAGATRASRPRTPPTTTRRRR